MPPAIPTITPDSLTAGLQQANLMLYLSAFFVLIVFIAFIAIILYSKSFKVRAIIFEQTGLGVKVNIRKAKKVEGLGNSKLAFVFSSKSIALPAGDYFFPTGKDTYLISLYKDKNNNFKPMSLRFETDTKNPLLVPDEADMRDWFVNQVMQARSAYQTLDKWSKIAPIFILGGVIVFATMILIIYGHYYFEGIKTGASAMNSGMNDLTRSLQTLANVYPSTPPQATPPLLAQTLTPAPPP